MQITKKEIIQKIYEIEEKEGLSLGREVQKVVRTESIPMDVIKLINKYDKNFLQIYDTYNAIYLSRNRNPLYRNLKNKDLAIPEMAVAISSLVTKILISCTKINNEEEKELFCTAMSIQELNEALTEYALYGKIEKLLQCLQQVRELLNLLYTE